MKSTQITDLKWKESRRMKRVEEKGLFYRQVQMTLERRRGGLMLRSIPWNNIDGTWNRKEVGGSLSKAEDTGLENCLTTRGRSQSGLQVLYLGDWRNAIFPTSTVVPSSDYTENYLMGFLKILMPGPLSRPLSSEFLEQNMVGASIFFTSPQVFPLCSQGLLLI